MQAHDYIKLDEFKNSFNPTDTLEEIERIAHNTFDYLVNNERRVRYTDTDIIIFNGNCIELFTGGFYTVTTKERLNRYLRHGFIYQNKHVWYYKKYQDKDTESVRFFEGIKIDKNTGNILNQNKAPKTKRIDKYNKMIERLIKNYCDKVNKLKTLPDNSNGDCFFCSLFNDNSNDNEHSLSHLKEKYVMFSLIMNALKYKGYNFPDFIYKIAYDKKDDRKSITDALKKYFKDKLIKR